VRGIGLQFVPQIRYVHVDDVVVVVFGPPDLLEQLPAREDPAGLSGQCAEQGELPSRDREVFSAYGQFVASVVDRELAKAARPWQP
jgi:hypothetical protein